MSYVNPILSHASRTRTLKTNYRFPCDCPWCDIRQDGHTSQEAFTTAELARIKESDTRREQLGTWIFTHLSYKKWSTDLCRADDLLIKAHKEALVLVEIENVYALQNLFIEEIAMAYATLGDVDEFRKWGTRLVQLCRVEDPKLAKKFDGWLVDPERRVKKWGWRRKQRELMRKGRKNAVEPPLEDGLFLDLFQVESD
ncbi:hypothetical protein NLJ89_g7062 [Agrocybe chaxingu]|uniref:Uncharacterized protein n=1 Tax=Agrocybe chaxingu TaxID=84603 RepID=A0A9W8JXJ4_9AGAR|nr:hypothetical protein NLJ89_g7062 [Agrocybe chaxingu]